jgi:hypothetical protein
MTQERRRLKSVIWIVSSIALFVAGLAGVAFAADDRDRDDATLVGTWRQTVIFPGVPGEFSDLTAFHEDGTLTERFGTGPGLSAGIGVWRKVGRGTFAVTFENFEDTNRDGTFDVRFRIRSTYHVIDRDTLTATGTSDTLSVDGTTELAPSFPGATVRATRMRVMPE